MNEEAKKARREYQKQWRKKNPEKIREIQKRYWEKQAEKNKAVSAN